VPKPADRHANNPNPAQERYAILALASDIFAKRRQVRLHAVHDALQELVLAIRELRRRLKRLQFGTEVRTLRKGVGSRRGLSSPRAWPRVTVITSERSSTPHAGMWITLQVFATSKESRASLGYWRESTSDHCSKVRCRHHGCRPIVDVLE